MNEFAETPDTTTAAPRTTVAPQTVQAPHPACADPSAGDAAERQAVLSEALCDTVPHVRGVAGWMCLLEPGGDGLFAEMIGGTPPEMFTMKDAVPLDSPFGTAMAWRAGRMVVLGESPELQTDDQVPSRLVPYPFLPFPYSLLSTPLIANGRKFGVLSIIRFPTRDGPLKEEEREWLQARCDRLAADLDSLDRRGVSVRAGHHSQIVPILQTERVEPPAAPCGLPEIPGSPGLTRLYHLHKLGAKMNEAANVAEVAEAARSHIMETTGAQSLVLGTVDDRRLWVAGHFGASPTVVKQLHGSAVEHGSPAADAILNREPLLFRTRDQYLAAGYTDTPNDGEIAWAFLPLAASGRMIGVCRLGFNHERSFGAAEQALLTMMADLLGPALERANLGENARTLAESLQRRLLPPHLSDSPEVATTARYLPASATASVGGDWYDVIVLPRRGQIGLVVGDVEGHNVNSSIIMGQLRSAVLAYAQEGHGPAALLARTSELLGELDTELMATCCFVRLDPTDGTAEVALAGHPAPVLVQSGNVIGAVNAPANLPLGVPGTRYESVEVTPDPGSLLLLYTDGLAPEAIAELPNLLDAYKEGEHRNLEELADRLILAAPNAPAHRNDDVVLLLAECQNISREPRHRTSRMNIQRHDLHGVQAARAFVHDSLHTWGLPAMTDEMELIASEMVTNALIHADSHVDVRLREYPDRVRMEVRDSDSSPPIPAPISTLEEENSQAEHGRGLLIVDSIASAWGSSPSGRGKTVWLEIKTAQDDEPPEDVDQLLESTGFDDW